MKFNLTSSQLNFYNKNFTLDSQIWNQGVMEIFPKVYSYQQINDAYNKLVETHDSLRVKLVETEKGVVADVKDHEYINYRFWQVETEEELMKKAQEFLNEPTDRYGLLVDCAVFQTPTTSGVMINAHHIVVDGFSALVMSEHINGFLKDENFAPIIQKYPDYVAKEEKYKQSRRYAKSKEFWLEEFSNNPQCSIFPATENLLDFSSAELNHIIPADLFSKIKDFCDKKEITPASFFNTVNATYLYKKYEVENLTIGVPVFNRTTANELNTIGLYMHLVPLVINIQDDSFINNAKKIENSQMNLFRHQSFTQQDIKALLNENNISVNQLFDVVSDFQEFTPNNEYEMRIPYGNSLSVPVEMHLQTFDIGKHNLKIRYRTAYFSENEIQIMLNAIIALAENAIENPDKNINEIEMISSAEKQKILNDFNNTKVEYAEDKCIHELFEEQAERTPDKIALVATDKKLTYKELNEEANKIANNLIAKGIGKGHIVGLMLPRKSYLLSALFGILKTGAAYLPIDMELPSERIEYMCKDTGASLVLSSDNINLFMESENTTNPSLDISNDSLCYCIYTSGSTGNPKGVMARHRNVVNYISKNEHNIFGKIIKEDFEAIVSISTCSFDIFVTETIATLVNGLRVVLADEQECRNQYALNRLLTKEKGQFLQTTPTKLKVLTAEPSQREFLKHVKAILLGGEAMEQAYLKELKQLTNAKIYNIYGVTEVPIWSAFVDTDTFTDAITIGHGIANTQMYVVDKYMNPVPIGITGELCIAGDSVSAGYLNQPTLTAEKFVDNPFGSGKLYKTGDHAYWREDGNLVFIGRKDFQVKIRGLRIELGEIESVLQAVNGVERAVVVVRKDKQDRQLLCAFYTGNDYDAKDLRANLSEKLPKYMVPHIFTHLEKMPMTASGKANRNALPDIDLENIVTETEYVAPTTVEETILTEAIQNILDCEKVSVLDNFFDLGGDSLKSIELVSEIEDKGYTVNVKAIFEAKSIQDLATQLIIKEAEKHVEYDSVLPATSAQMRVYTAQMVKPEATHYNICYLFKSKDLDKDALQNAVNRLVERHESLRTHFENREGQIVQVINEQAKTTIEKFNSEKIETFVKPFNLEKAPLIRVGYDKNMIAIDMHHIIVDGESMPVIFKELNELYMGRDLPDVVQYGEFAITDTYTEENEKYWLNVFGETVEVLDLKTDYARPEKQSFKGTNIYTRIDRELDEKIAEKCKALNITPYAYYMACYNILLSKYSGKEDICVGMATSGRSSKYLNTVGMFVNTLALRNSPEGLKSFKDFAIEVKENSVEAINNQNYPFGELVKKLDITTSNRNPLFDVMFTYQSEKMTDVTFGDKKAELVPIPVTSVKSDLCFYVLPRKEDVVLIAEYCTDLFKEETINKFIAAYSSILTQALNETTLIKDISVLSDEEKENLLTNFNNTTVDYGKDKCIHELFEEQAERTPDKIALVATDKKLTYKELNEEANKIANNLIAKGIGKGHIVGLMLPRKSSFLVALLGILKAGATYLPIDPEHPTERIEGVLSDSNAKLCITEENVEDLLNNTNKENPNVKTQSEDICYCIYTSGSTGKPKGAMIRHKNLIWYMSSLTSIYGNIEARMPFFTSQSVDLSVTSIFFPLVTGGTTYFYASDLLKNLSNIINNEELNIIKLTPTHIQIINQNIAAKNITNIEHLIVGGEQLYAATCAEFLEKFGNHIKIHNEYGPTETTVGCGDYVFTFSDTDTAVSIGHPMNNVQLYIVDKYLNPMPIGVIGELCIAGDGVCAGYLNREDLTNEKFIHNPFGEGKLYKTGDLAYWREDGQICYVGRNDFQVKIRGQRIELGEIENAILSMDGVVQCAVVVRKDNDNGQYICAFYTGNKIESKELRSTLSAKLPRYMVPHIFTHLEEMPLTSSGKINRNALPQIDFNNISTEIEFVAPVTQEEKALADVVCSVLRTNNVNMLDNFFNVGGDSINAIYVVSELEDLGYELHVADIMQSDTFSDVAKAMNSTSNKEIYAQTEVNGTVPFTPIMRTYLNENNSIQKDFVHTCIVSADCDEDIARKALDMLVSHHDILRGALTDNGINILPYNERKAYSFKSINIENIEEAKEYLNNINVNNDELVNVVFCKTEKETLLKLTVHHFLIDLVSWEILMEDFKTIVEQLKNNNEISLPAKTASFKLWSEELSKYSETISDENKEYWENINNKLDNTKPLCSMNESENESERFTFTFDKEISNKLVNEANTAYGTRTHEVLLTALGLAAGKITNGSVGIIVESHGRTDLHNPIAIERTVGWFTSCYPVVINNSENVVEELINTKETTRRTPKNGIDYLLLFNGFHKNTDIIFNFYRNNFEYDNRNNELVGFNSETSLFPNKLSVDCSVIDNILTVSIAIPKCNHKLHITEELGVEFIKQIENIVDICTSTDTVIKTRSDFSDNKLTENELNELNDLFGGQNIKDVYILTPSQEGMYAQYFQSTDTKAYNLQNLCEIGKDTDLEKLKKSVELLSLRHEVLKTAVTVLKATGAIKQVVLESRKPEFTVLTQNTSFSQDALDKLVDEDANASLDLQKDSLFRVTIVDFTDARFMLMHAHHIILDGWCLPVIFADLQKYYGELINGISIEELTAEINKEVSSQTSYAQYANWIKDQNTNQISEYWQNLLSDCDLAHIFNKEKKDNSINEDIVTFETLLTDDLSQSIEQFAKENKVSPNTVFECAFSIALQKYSGSDDVVFDKIVSGRSIPLKNIENTVGPFINTVPVRIKSDEGSTLTDLLKETHNQTVNANKNGILPLADIYKSCSIEAKSVDFLFVFENYFVGDISEITNGPLSPKVISFNEQTEFNLTITIIKENNVYAVRTAFAKDLYSEREASTFTNGFISILSSLNNASLIKDISVLSNDEKNTILNDFNNTNHTYNIPANTTLYSLFEKASEENSDKVCIIANDKEITFKDFRSYVERIDSKIRTITDEKSVIAVICERSFEMYGAVYGILRGGNAYLPIDPNYPQDRIDYILGNSGAKAVIAQDKFCHLAGDDIPCIDATFVLNTIKQPAKTPVLASENDTAYVIYTSGSTGNPKGAKISHKSAINRILWMHDFYPLEENDVILQKTPYTFDVSVWELFWWGITGRTLCASKPDEHFLPAKILDETEKNKVTHLHFVPSVFDLFLTYLENNPQEQDKFNSVKYVFLSGEALTANHINRFYNIYDYNKVSLHNLYGPTECAVDVSYYPCVPTDTDPVPIGKPIYNTQLHIVDKYLSPTPIGVIGELCIAGVNVGQGYLNNEQLTNEKFIPNPFGSGKLYKTGDLAYWREDGEIYYVGRMDGQIKLNGQRIELGEIEKVIGEVSTVESVAVTIKQNNGKDILVAFCCADESTENEIVEHCENKLPQYMIPSKFIFIEKMPLNQSGKLDRKALKNMNVSFDDTVIKEEPITNAEKLISKLFQETLYIDFVGRNDNFFTLGGTSLHMISILSEDELKNISAAEFIANPTVKKLAKLLESDQIVDSDGFYTLKRVPSSTKALIFLPFAGGDASAFAALTKELEEKSPELSLYYVDYLRSYDECLTVAEKIKALSKTKEINIYSHCAGTAVALQLINILESQGVNISDYIVGGFIPPAKAGKLNAWNYTPKWYIQRKLVKAGAPIDKVSTENKYNMVNKFRKDTDFMTDYFYKNLAEINASTSVLISKTDIFTKNYKDAERLWKTVARNFKSVHYIDTDSHYFQSDNSKQVAQIIIDIMTK